MLRWSEFPTLKSMRSDQPKAFYSCLLMGKYPLAEKRGAEFYKKVMRGELAPDAVGGEPEEQDAVVNPPRKRLAAQMDAEPEGDDMSSDVVAPGPIAAPSPDSSSSSSTSSSSASSQSDVVDPDADGGEEEPWPERIDGGACRVEHRPGVYHRLILTCIHHPGCVKKRNTHVMSSACVDMGRMDSISYLACWMARGAGVADAEGHRREHQRSQPTAVEQRRWAAGQAA